MGEECKGVQFADHLALDDENLTLNGVGVQKATFLKIDVYVGALYVTTVSRDPDTLIDADTTQLVLLHFLRDVRVQDVRQQWTRDFTHVVPDRPASLMQRVKTLNSWLADVKANQELTFIRKPGEGLDVIVAGVPKGTIPGEDFSRVFMRIWLGAAPPSAALRRGFLGGPCN